MIKEFEKVNVKEVYIAPMCECIEISPEGILCGSSIQANEGLFGSEGDIYVGEW